MEDWKVVSSENGITVLRGAGQHNASSIMLSFIVRAPPRLCVKVSFHSHHSVCEGCEPSSSSVDPPAPRSASKNALSSGLQGFCAHPELCIRGYDIQSA